MKKIKLSVMALSFLLSFSALSNGNDTKNEKEWTMIVFMNGHNNLDEFTHADLNEMEVVGSNESMNIVVQWASYEAQTTKRVYVTRDEDRTQVTSTIVEDIPRVDMGDWTELVEFIKWSVDRYPAKRYFIDVWNHGSGWHAFQNNRFFTDISNDDFTHNAITTKQLGMALKEASTYIGRKIDIYGSDACLMAMVEVAYEMKDAVSVFVGSQELEPGDGWPYDKVLGAWSALEDKSPKAVASALVEHYGKHYQGQRGITQSALDVEKLAELKGWMSAFSKTVSNLSDSQIETFKSVVRETKDFLFFSDYKDMKDLVLRLSSSDEFRLDDTLRSRFLAAHEDLVIANTYSEDQEGAHGVSLWVPQYDSVYAEHIALYENLDFSRDTGWGAALGFVY